MGTPQADRRTDRGARRRGGVRRHDTDRRPPCRYHPHGRECRSIRGLAMARPALRRLFAAIAVVATIAIQTVSAQQDDQGSPRAQSPVTFLQINDVYSTVPIDGAGGL